MDLLLIDNNLPFNEKFRERRLSNSSVATEDSGYSSIFRTVNSIRIYSTQNEYLVAMMEDLAIWLGKNHSITISVENFFDILETGVILCKQAVLVQTAGEIFIADRNNANRQLPGKWSNCYLKLPYRPPTFRNKEITQTFIARDNIANFIGWLRELGFSNSVMFETEDLISRKNVKNVILALLELARVGGLFGLTVPNLVELEQEIDAELESIKNEERADRTLNKIPRLRRSSYSQGKPDEEQDIERPKHVIQPKPYAPECDIKSLDELVREILLECECESVFPMSRVAEGKYFFGEKDMLIFVRVLRNHVMVRVGGGWDTLNNLLFKHDPCRRDKPRGTLQVQSSTEMNQTGTLPKVKTECSSGIPSHKSFRRLSVNCPIELEAISSKLQSIPISSHKNSRSKVKRRCSLQMPRPVSIPRNPRMRGSKIPVLRLTNLKSIKETSSVSSQTSSKDFNETSSAPCSRQPSPEFLKRNLN